MGFTRTPEPPYYAVIFTTMRVNDPNDGYRLNERKIGKDGLRST